MLSEGGSMSRKRGYPGQGAVTIMTHKGPYEAVCEECQETKQVFDVTIDWVSYTVCEDCGNKIVYEVVS
jgi:hypothetical protein